MMCITRSHEAFVAKARTYGLVVLICLAVWWMGERDTFWPQWVILFVVIRLGLAARRVYGRT